MTTHWLASAVEALVGQCQGKGEQEEQALISRGWNSADIEPQLPGKSLSPLSEYSMITCVS